jgi:hypothetical protein
MLVALAGSGFGAAFLGGPTLPRELLGLMLHGMRHTP